MSCSRSAIRSVSDLTTFVSCSMRCSYPSRSPSVSAVIVMVGLSWLVVIAQCYHTATPCPKAVRVVEFVATLNGCDRKLSGIPLGVAGWGERVFGHPEVRSPDGLGERVFGRGGANYQILRLTNFK